MTTRRKILLAALAVAGVLVAAAVLIHLPATHRLAERIHGVHPHGPPGAATGVTDGDIVGPFGTVPGASPETTARALEGVAAIGSRWDAAAFAETAALYTAVHREIEWPGLLEPETVVYGPHAQQTFELFRPEQGFSEPGPVFVFVHGNGLGNSEPAVPGSAGLIWSHMGKLTATFGAIGLTMNYRHGAGSALESGAEDLRLVLEWIDANIAPYGGDPGTVVVLGNSEGATTVAAYLFDEHLQKPGGPGIAAAMLSSGLFGAQAPEMARLVDTYHGEAVPLALWYGEFDTQEVASGIAALHRQLCLKYEDCPALEELEGHNHVSHIMSLGTPDSSVLSALIRFYHTVR